MNKNEKLNDVNDAMNKNLITPKPTQTETLSFSSKIYDFMYKLIFELPIKNYRELYLTGKLQSMSQDEKIKMIIDNSKDEQHRRFFNRLLKVRPAFLDDEDLDEFNKFESNIKTFQIGIFSSLFLNWTYFSYNFIVKKRNKLKLLICLNIFIFCVYTYSKIYAGNFYGKLFDKYKTIVKQDDIFRIMKNSYRIEV